MRVRLKKFRKGLCHAAHWFIATMSSLQSPAAARCMALRLVQNAYTRCATISPCSALAQ
jgi:hypothetical protein